MKASGASKADIVRATSEIRLDWQYVYASQGQDCTPEWRRSRIPYCPSKKYVDMINDNCPVLSGKQPTIYCNKPHSNEKMISPESCDGCGYVDTDVFDCAGFVLNELQLAGVPFYGQGATTQWNTASNWAAKGEISTMPRDLVCAIYKRKDGKMSHAGLSMGDGNGGAIHCSTTVKRGNAYTDNPKWTHWGVPAGLYTIEELKKAGLDVSESKNVPILRKGSEGPTVKAIQNLLNQWGANLNVDGIFGAKTEAAVKDFQSTHKLTADGIVGPKTRAILDPLGLIGEACWGVQGEETSSSIEVENRIAEKLLASGMNLYGVAGVIGNLQVESGLNPKNLNGNGNKLLGMSDDQYTEAVDSGVYTAEQFANDGFAYGLAQWCHSSRKANLLAYVKNAGTSVGDIDAQVDFLVKELKTYKVLWPILQNAGSVDEATVAVLEMFEKPANQSEAAKERRITKAKETLERMLDRGSVMAEQNVPYKEPSVNMVHMAIQDLNAIRTALSSIASVLKKYE